jgi:translation initiation factor 4G
VFQDVVDLRDRKWVATGPRPPPKAGDLSNFGKINKFAPMTFGPSSVFAGKRDNKGAPSASDLFSKFSQSPVTAAEAAAFKSIQPGRWKHSVQPAHSENTNLKSATMSEVGARQRIEEDCKELFTVRNLKDAESYFANLAVDDHFRLIDKLVTSALGSKEADSQLVADFFKVVGSKKLCSPASFEKGFLLAAEILDDIAVDVPKSFNFMAIMMKGATLNEEQRTRIAAKSMDGDKLISGKAIPHAYHA